ncbi:hypothetical protein [Psychrosphaera algicola]|uniref:SMODS and SLOG-associating 2TM effector domain-containing protein n=1 Tax=Psychrosphaera algicola TaxID=3023714 RepID=A0ABT5FFX8_9GAMM|nr:hypothetical protein [Psychrosphaera sp. G1-22]MDC2890457.1 hypothetical protein [Psychrosphaera sp. G1-22]
MSKRDVLLDWFENQRAYFNKSHHRLHGSHEKAERFIKISIYLPIIILFLVLFPWTYYLLNSFVFLGISGKVWAVFLSALIPVIGLINEQLAVNKSLKEQSQFANQHIIFLDQAIEAIQNKDIDEENIDKTALIAAQELSNEHVIWLNINNIKTLTTAHGG